MPAFEAKEGMPYWQDVATSDARKSTYFYSKLLEWDIDQGSYPVARKEGLPVAGFIPQPDNAWVTYFYANDLEDMQQRVEKHGGRVAAVAEVSLGQMAVCADPSGSLFGLIEPAGEDQFVAAGEPGTPVWYEYVTHGRECLDFYAELFDWEVAESEGYYFATVDGSPFLGVRDDPTVSGPGFWDLYLGVDDIRQAARRAEVLGGTVIAGPELSPFGPLVTLRDATGAAVTLCEVPVVDSEASESDSILNL